MKNPWTLVGVGVALLAGLSFSQGQGSKDPVPAPQDPNARKFEIIEQDLISTRAKLEDTATQLAETKAVLAKTLRYLDAQAKSAALMAETLDESEKAGFTFGINPDSRQILLAGWREQLAVLQKDVPVALTPPKTALRPGDAPDAPPATKK